MFLSELDLMGRCGGTFQARATRWAGFSPIRALAAAMREHKLDEERRATLSAMHSKHWPTVSELLSPSDKSVLVRAASSEDTDAVRALIDNGGSLDARDQYGDTALICAASTGRSENVKMLVDAGADLEARDTGGRTALMWAALANHMGIMEYLIKAGASVDAIGGSRARTALMIAAERGCENAVRVLLANGATTLISDCDGKTAMDVARTRHIRRMIRKHGDAPRERSSAIENLLHRHFGRKKSNSHKAKPSDNSSVVSCLTMTPSVGMSEIQALCQLMQESRFVCDRIYERLAEAPSELAQTSGNGSNDSYRLVLEDFQAFLTVYTQKHPITRLLSSNLIMQTSRSLHTRLDTIESGTGRSEVPVSWQHQWEIDSKTHQQLLMEFMAENNVNAPVAAEEDARVEALTLLSFECERRKSKYTTQQLYLIHKYLQACTRTTHAPAVSVPKWFIPAYEIEMLRNADARDNRDDSMCQGTWYELPVAIKAVNNSSKSRKHVKRYIEARIGLQHPHIRQLHGACHVGDRPFLVFEDTSNETLAKNLNRKSLESQASTEPLRGHYHYRMIWRKLYQVALALEYLHERKIAHGELHRSSSIVVDVNGDVKLNVGIQNAHPVVAGTRSSVFSSDCRATRSGDAFTSDVYTLGLLIFNCMMQSELPSEIDVNENETLPKRPTTMTNAHWMLIERMCASNALQRCDIAFALQKIKQFADL